MEKIPDSYEESQESPGYACEGLVLLFRKVERGAYGLKFLGWELTKAKEATVEGTSGGICQAQAPSCTTQRLLR